MLWSVAGIILAGTGMRFYGTHTEQDPETGESNITQMDPNNVQVSYSSILRIFNELRGDSTCG